MGKSLCEHDLIDTAREIASRVEIPLPVDVVVASEFAETATATTKNISDVSDDDTRRLKPLASSPIC